MIPLSLLVNPNLAVLLLLVGIFLIYAECNRPGNVLLGSCGTFAVLLATYNLSRLPIQPLALVALLTGVVLLLLELRAPTRNLLALAGTAAIVAGLATLTHPPIHPLVALATGTLFPLVTLPLARIALRARRNKRIHFDPRTTPATSTGPAPE